MFLVVIFTYRCRKYMPSERKLTSKNHMDEIFYTCVLPYTAATDNTFLLMDEKARCCWAIGIFILEQRIQSMEKPATELHNRIIELYNLLSNSVRIAWSHDLDTREHAWDALRRHVEAPSLRFRVLEVASMDEWKRLLLNLLDRLLNFKPSR